MKKKAVPKKVAQKAVQSAPKKSVKKTSKKVVKKTSISTTLPEYNHIALEKKWQKKWEVIPKLYKAVDDDKKREKKYILVEFPFPSGAGLHVGHVRSYTALDVIARKNRMEGKNVLFPIGWDAFGLPTENYAIKTGVQPTVATKQNTETFLKQLKSLGYSFDWNRIVNTTDPEYYKWTQWIFLKMLKAGLAYRDKISINWCPKDKIGLANEEVIAGCCERCGTKVEKREKEQWMLAITKYADRLDADLDLVDYPDRVKAQQRNWIGKSTGAEIDFALETSDGRKLDSKVTVFTTRPDTLFGVTYLVLAPEHRLVGHFENEIRNASAVKAYVKKVSIIDEAERTAADKEKTGLQIDGLVAVHPLTGEKLPVWIADYVLATYGTGAIMAVPAHDERDRDFAEKFNLPIKEVVDREGSLINSGEFNGTKSEVAKVLIVKKANGKLATKYKLRDWVFSRQRYWGEPIPVVYCEDCGIVPLPEKELPLTLPKVKKYEPTDNGESPLASISNWVNTKCPKCKGKAKRETDTMPNWAGSSWYYLRYTDPKNKKEFASQKNLKYWTPVDWYNGGMEHTTLHLLYSRFWHKFLYDQKLVPTKEPYAKRTSHGLIMAHDGTKMAKSKGNSVSPDQVTKTYGADTLRLYELFIAPFEQAAAWKDEGLTGPRRFIERVYRLHTKIVDTEEKKATELTGAMFSKEARSLLHKTIKKVTEDIETLSHNTAVSAMMILVNQLEKEVVIPVREFKLFLAMIAPFTPFLAEELFEYIKTIAKSKASKITQKSVHELAWPQFDPTAIVDDELEMPIQINGKMRGTIKITVEDSKNEKTVVSAVLALAEIRQRVGEEKVDQPDKVIFVPGKIINLIYKGL